MKRNKTYDSNQNIFIYLLQSRSVGTFLKLILLSFENQFRYVTPPIVHTLSKPFPGVCHVFYQDIAGVKLVTSSQMMAFTSLGPWAVQITRDLEKHPEKKSQGVKLKNQKHKHCYAGKRYVKY